MKKLLLALFISTCIVIGIFIYDRIVVVGQLGPTAMTAILILSLFSLSLLLSFFLYGTRYHEALMKFWLTTSSVAVSYLVVDLAAGYFLIERLSPELMSDANRHHKLVPNSLARFEQRDFSYIQRVNNFGMRGKDIDFEKDKDKYRIIMLGDSFTMGKGVEDDQTFSALVQKRLDENTNNCNKYRNIEVLNAGVDSYAPILSYIQLSRDLVALEPDMVVLNLDVSDLTQEAAYRDIGTRDSIGRVISVPGPDEEYTFSEVIRDWVDNNLYMTRLILFYTNKLLGYRDLTVRGVVTQANREIVAYTLASDTADRNQQWESLFESIIRIRDFCKERGIQFILTIYPWAHQVSDDEWIPGRYTFMSKEDSATDANLEIVDAFTKRSNIDFLSLFENFRSYNQKEKLYFDYDMHWTPAGHNVMANGISSYLTKRYSSAWCKQ